MKFIQLGAYRRKVDKILGDSLIVPSPTRLQTIMVEIMKHSKWSCIKFILKRYQIRTVLKRSLLKIHNNLKYFLAILIY